MRAITPEGEPIEDAVEVGPARRDPTLLRRLLILRLYAAGESPTVIGRVFRCSRQRVHQELAAIDLEIGERAIG